MSRFDMFIAGVTFQRHPGHQMGEIYARIGIKIVESSNSNLKDLKTLYRDLSTIQT